MKRSFDVVVSALTLVSLGLPMLIVGVIVLWTMGRPVLFRQIRPGRGGVPFNLLKFRTMRAPRFDGEDDSARLTRFGRWLRDSSIDELPELWNVLKGDMSLVGPRPLLMEYLALYSPEQRRRHEVRPGITGWAQVNGRNQLDWEARFAMDVWYVDHQSFGLDLQILSRTLRIVLRREGIHQEGHATMPKFTGDTDSVSESVGANEGIQNDRD
ncbi:MAG: sugar transferase [Pseudomonadota bacterium]